LDTIVLLLSTLCSPVRRPDWVKREGGGREKEKEKKERAVLVKFGRLDGEVH
jgi:hypothetical protein